MLNELIAVVGTLLSVYFGYYLSDRQWQKQATKQMKNIAQGIYNEILLIEDLISPIVDEYDKVTVGSPSMLNDIIYNTKVDLNIYKSLYNESGLYFHFRKEIQDFDSSIIKDIEQFYTNLLSADKCYRVYMNLLYEQKVTFREIGRTQGYIHHYLKKTLETSLSLKKSLEDYIKSNN
ncbi:hypothetical protein [Methanomethylovorans sp.]|uniref:hypothetical protein n=1 Tax=Methanomethylovorans sp. TaxID=2758717 RepID=UPI001BD56F30|nr:hypothetical protein [Methanomethylovorans sp.]